jgi:DeoR/GlpR family transcriptional regulator of sugar metabolism
MNMYATVKLNEEKEFLPMDRHLTICKLVRNNKTVTIRRLAEMFGVSKMTIHRDLRKLEDDGQIKRRRGVVMPAEKMEFEFDFAMKRETHQTEKKAIAKEALKFIEPGHNIILDTGTTTLELAYLLKNFENITVVTPSIAVASVLQFSENVRTVLLGGFIRYGSPDLTGIITEKNLDMFKADVAFQGADSIGLDGKIYVDDVRILQVDLKIRNQASKTYILADSSKIGKTAFATNCYINQVHALITDDGIDPECKKEFEKMGAKIIIAKP